MYIAMVRKGMRSLQEWEVERVSGVGVDHNLEVQTPDLVIFQHHNVLAWLEKCRENCLRDLEDVRNASYLVVHLIFKKKSSAYTFLSHLMYDQSSTMLYFCQRHFNSDALISFIFIIDLITKLLTLSSWQHLFERKRLPSTILLSLLYFNSYIWK